MASSHFPPRYSFRAFISGPVRLEFTSHCFGVDFAACCATAVPPDGPEFCCAVSPTENTIAHIQVIAILFVCQVPTCPPKLFAQLKSRAIFAKDNSPVNYYRLNPAERGAPPHPASRSVLSSSRAQPVECAGSAAAFPKPTTPQNQPAPSASKGFSARFARPASPGPAGLPTKLYLPVIQRSASRDEGSPSCP